MDTIALVVLLLFFLLAVVKFMQMWKKPDHMLLDRPASKEEQALLSLLEKSCPDIKGLLKVRLQRGFYGWVCTATSTIPAVSWQYQLYAWGIPDIDKIAQMFAGPIQSLLPDAKSYWMAVDILGEQGVEEVSNGTYYVKSGLNSGVEYRFACFSTTIYHSWELLGSFCLNARGRYPKWDVILSRILMVQGSELDFLRKANFYGPVPPYFAVPITRDLFIQIFGEEALEQWDTYTSSTPAKVTQR